MSVPGFSWPQPPLILLTVMQHVLAQVGPYLCNVIPGRREWQPCRFFLHSFWGLFAPLGIRLQIKNGGNRFFPFRTMGLTSCTLQGYWFGLIVAVLQGVLCQNPHRTEHIIGVQAVWSLLEADDCKKHLCLRTNVKKAENGRIDVHDTIYQRSSGT